MKKDFLGHIKLKIINLKKTKIEEYMNAEKQGQFTQDNIYHIIKQNERK